MAVMQQIQFEVALTADDPRYVNTQEARGSEQTYQRLAKKFGYNPASNAFMPPSSVHLLLFGHVGSGKTTELRQYAQKFTESGHYYVVEVDVMSKLDRNNLQFSETMLVMAERLAEQLAQDGYTVTTAALEPVLQWFRNIEQTGQQQQELSATISGEISAGGGLPGLFKLLSKITTTAKTGSSRKTAWREEVRNRFSELAEAFNQLLVAAEQALGEANGGKLKRILFVLDGTDKMKSEDTARFFVQDAEQLLALNALVIYTAPLYLKYQGNLVGRLQDIVLPMIKLQDKEGAPYAPGLQAMCDLLLRRADTVLFRNDAVIDRLVQHSGGHPRELLRLLQLCCEYADEIIDLPELEKAEQQLAADFRRFLTKEDYELLVQIDHESSHQGTSEQIQNLLYKLALMEYNDGSWRRSHPAVRLLEGYQQAKQRLFPEIKVMRPSGKRR
jgi:Cdc6-like AAA superfamily ATPase